MSANTTRSDRGIGGAEGAFFRGGTAVPRHGALHALEGRRDLREEAGHQYVPGGAREVETDRALDLVVVGRGEGKRRAHGAQSRAGRGVGVGVEGRRAERTRSSMGPGPLTTPSNVFSPTDRPDAPVVSSMGVTR